MSSSNVWVALASPNSPVGAVPYINSDQEPDVDVLNLFYDSVQKMLRVLNGVSFDFTLTAPGTTGAQTIQKPCGFVNFAAAAQTLVVTNYLVDGNSLIIPVVLTDDATAKSCIISAQSVGSFTLKLNAAATAETKVGFLMLPLGKPIAQ
jgi:hypothetical protein